MTYQEYIRLKPGDLVKLYNLPEDYFRFAFVSNINGAYVTVQCFDSPDNHRSFISPHNFDNWYIV